MSKKELIAAVAEKTGMTKKATAEAVAATFDVIKDTVAAGEQVALVGFGTFKVVERGARTCRNPRTGEAVEVAAHNVPVFKAGKALKEAVK